jgi:TonB family protein
VRAQGTEAPTQPPTTAPTVLNSQARIERARALAAAHKLDVAASELEGVRKNPEDEVVRNVTSVMLMGIYLEEGNYVRAQSLLEEDFQARSSRKDASLRTYFATAGQAINGARAHLARYRSFGLNVTDLNLPSEAVTDLDRLRALLERMVAQAKEIAAERKGYDVLALLEDVLGIRTSIPRDEEDRAKWDAEYAAARQGLATSQTEIASLGGVPPLTRGVNSPASQPAAKKEKPADTTDSSNGLANTTSAVQPANPNPAPATPTSNTSGSSEPKDLGSLNSRAVSRVIPAYPPMAKSSRIEGVVKVFVTIDESGRVTDVSSVDGPILLRQAAESAARNWKFLPTVVDGQAVPSSGYIEFSFKL